MFHDEKPNDSLLNPFFTMANIPARYNNSL